MFQTILLINMFLYGEYAKVNAYEWFVQVQTHISKYSWLRLIITPNSLEDNYYAHYFNKHSDHMVTNLSSCQYSTLNIGHICRKKLN